MINGSSGGNSQMTGAHKKGIISIPLFMGLRTDGIGEKPMPLQRKAGLESPAYRFMVISLYG
jgi:hypothetical protein